MLSSFRKPAANAEVAIRKARKSTYTEPLRDKSKEYTQQELDDLKDYLSDFYRNIYKRRDECSTICQENPKTVGHFFETLVPRFVTFEDFWQRYFYRCDPDRIIKEWDRQVVAQKQQLDQKIHDSMQSAQKFWTNTVGPAKPEPMPIEQEVKGVLNEDAEDTDQPDPISSECFDKNRESDRIVLKSATDDFPRSELKELGDESVPGRSHDLQAPGTSQKGGDYGHASVEENFASDTGVSAPHCESVSIQAAELDMSPAKTSSREENVEPAGEVNVLEELFSVDGNLSERLSNQDTISNELGARLQDLTLNSSSAPTETDNERDCQEDDQLSANSTLKTAKKQKSDLKMTLLMKSPVHDSGNTDEVVIGDSLPPNFATGSQEKVSIDVIEPKTPVPKIATAWNSAIEPVEKSMQMPVATPIGARKELESMRQHGVSSSVKDLKAFWNRNERIVSPETAAKVAISPGTVKKFIQPSPRLAKVQMRLEALPDTQKLPNTKFPEQQTSSSTSTTIAASELENKEIIGAQDQSAQEMTLPEDVKDQNDAGIQTREILNTNTTNVPERQAPPSLSTTIAAPEPETQVIMRAQDKSAQEMARSEDVKEQNDSGIQTREVLNTNTSNVPERQASPSLSTTIAAPEPETRVIMRAQDESAQEMARSEDVKEQNDSGIQTREVLNTNTTNIPPRQTSPSISTTIAAPEPDTQVIMGAQDESAQEMVPSEDVTEQNDSGIQTREVLNTNTTNVPPRQTSPSVSTTIAGSEPKTQVIMEVQEESAQEMMLSKDVKEQNDAGIQTREILNTNTNFPARQTSQGKSNTIAGSEPENQRKMELQDVSAQEITRSEDMKEQNDSEAREILNTNAEKKRFLSYKNMASIIFIGLLAVGSAAAVWVQQDLLCAPAMGELTDSRYESPFWAAPEWKTTAFDVLCGANREKTTLQWIKTKRGLFTLLVEQRESLIVKRERLTSAWVSPEHIFATNKKGDVETILAPWAKGARAI